MQSFAIGMPPVWLMQCSVATVWLYEGLWCKLLGCTPSQVEVVTAVPRLGARFGVVFLKALGVLEVALAVWVISGVATGLCADVYKRQAITRLHTQHVVQVRLIRCEDDVHLRVLQVQPCNVARIVVVAQERIRAQPQVLRKGLSLIHI